MAVFAAIAFATFFLENDHFVTFYEGLSHFANYFCTFYGGCADFNGTVSVRQQYAVKFYFVACLYVFAEIVNIQVAVLFSFELLSLNFYDNVHLNYCI